ncbi:MAG: AMP-binding protein, partial [Verrucomicrobiae bacterium]|nr:AMP-binding protein [Verrucomicrobiae bacterium]
MGTLTALFERTALRHRWRRAIFCGREKVRYRDVRSRSLAVARLLLETYGVRPGDRVGLLLKNCPEFVYAVYGILFAGGTIVPINNFLKPQEIEFILHDAGVRTLVSANEDFGPVLEHLHANVTGLRLLDIATLRWAELAAPQPGVLPGVRPADRAVIIYTSGTTGRPKGAVLTHRNLVANIQSCIQVLESVERDRIVLALPMFHSFMMTVAILLPLSIGASVLVIKSIKPFRNVLLEMVRRRATVFLGIPQIFQALAMARIPWWVHWLLPLRLAISGSAPLAVETLKRFGERFRFPLIEGYGLSEA